MKKHTLDWIPSLQAGLRTALTLGAVGAAVALAPSLARADTFLFSALAGGGVTLDHTDGTGSNARFFNPTGVAVDTAGNIYVADGGDHTVRKVTAGGTVTTIAGASGIAGSADGVGPNARFVYPFAVATDINGNVYVTDVGDHTVKRITPAGLVTTLAGSAGVAGSVDGVTTSAQLNYPEGIAADATGNVYISDTGNSTIRKIAVNGTVSTFAGVAGQTGSADGNGAGARFNFPAGIAIDAAGNIYVADHGNSTIRKITSGGTVTTLAGSASATGSADGTAASATFDHPNAVAVDAAGNVYVIDTSNQLVRKLSISTGSVTTLSGAPTVGGNVDGAGVTARFFYPFGIAVTGAGQIYVADTGNHTLRAISAAGSVSTLAGAMGTLGAVDGTGGGARFAYPAGVAVDASGNVYVADHNNNTIRRITSSGTVTTLAGSTTGVAGGVDGVGTAARFNSPTGVAVDGSGNAYVADANNNVIRKITSAGTVTTFATGFNAPQGVAVDTAGNVYVADTNNNIIRKITAAGAVSTIAGASGQAGSNDGTGAGARFNGPIALAVNSSGNIFVADFGNGTIRKVTPAGAVTTLAGLAGQVGDTDGFGSLARFNQTYAIAADNSGNVFVADTNNRAIRKIDAAGNVSTVSGARFYYPQGLAIDAAGNLYVADGDNQSISKGLFVAPPPSGTVIGDQAVTAGGSASFTVGAATAGVTYQWQLSTDGGATWNNVSNGTTYTGAGTSTLSISNATTAMSGTKYRAMLSNSAGTTTSAVGTLTVTGTTQPPPPGTARLINLSVRTQVGTGANTVFVGFALNGTGSKQMLIRGVGPTLTQFNVTGVLAQPSLTLYNSASTALATNTAWGGSASMAATFTSVGAFALPTTSADCAIVRAMTPAAYTAQIAGVGGTTGIALAEFYDADGTASTTRLYNISARATVGSGVNSLVTGFVIGGGSGSVTLLIRGIGPALAQFNLSGVLATPTLTLFDSNNAQLASNTGWSSGATSTTTLNTAFDQVGAFHLPVGSADCAMLVTLPPGLYTAQISSGVGAPGLGLIEVYEIR